ncbi:TPA: type IV pilus twitching motility protein PilT [Kluyvera ascorbata F0526]|uniref:type IV pilus twitching motility protein PilT n=1 Tax=Kluyvera ascorbata TaxID=51288 RepID=UPI002928A8F7|nr:type IV pilus twitching motility protein PilT [Kluyvera ascorbata F0526]
MDIQEMVSLSVKHNVSDLHLCSSGMARWRQAGQLLIAPFPSPEPQILLDAWLSETQRREWQQRQQLDFALSLAGCPRLRASAFAHSGGVSLVLRLLSTHCPSLDELHTPVALAELLREESGLILVTGSTGSGKSTTLAAMVDHLNHQLAGHIVTLEDPVEFLHESGSCLIHQREVGLHTSSFSEALRAALRQDPDVILLGELRDSETIRLALTAAETGHLVLATLHTRGAAQAIERLIDVFPAQEKDPVRHQLASSLCAVLSQKLQSDKHGGRVALFEMLINTPAVGNLIREGKTHQLAGVMQTGLQSGMQTFSQSYQQRVKAGML